MQSRQQDWHAPMQTPSTIACIHAAEGAAVTKSGEILDNQHKNWSAWSQSMALLFKLFKVQEYVLGKITCPDSNDDPVGAENWGYNDTFAQLLITSNIAPTERVHTNGCPTSNRMWLSLQSMHESTSHLILTTHLRTLMNTTAAEDDNIPEHISKLKQCWDQLSLFRDTNYRVSEFLFKRIIASSLPESWDQFTDQFVAGQLDFVDTDPKKNIDNQQFIGYIKQEYERRQSCKSGATSGKSSEQALFAHGRDNAKPPLASRITGNTYNQNRTSPPTRCRICRLTNHYTRDCRFKGKPKCATCRRFGHKTKDHRNAGTSEHAHDDDGGGNRYNSNKRPQQEANKADSAEQANAAEHEDHIAFMAEVADVDDMDTDNDIYDDAKYHNYEHVPSSTELELRLIYYDWIADTGATSHITHRRDAFNTYEPIPGIPISGIGGAKAHAIGQGNIKLKSKCNGRTYILELKNVLHVPKNRNNLLSLGKWETNGRSYNAYDGTLSLLTKERKPVAKGAKISNDLYKMTFMHAPRTSRSDYAFSATSPSQSWETWHRRFGHVGYSGIKMLLDNQLVEGLQIDMNSPKPGCVACTEAKLSVAPYGPAKGRQTKIGELTHMDLWGKYDVASIHGNQYYLLLIDDAAQYITVEFLKTKDQAAQKIKNYMTYLKAQSKTPSAIRADRGTEFVNENLRNWCQSQGIELQVTAPYSPSQNGVAERMNRTLVELARAMLTAADLPEFLWEPAVAHAAYLRNMSYTKPRANTMPYQLWHGRKPNVSHLREFGAPVWVLLQGQRVQRKMLPKSQRKAYVGYNEGSKSIMYYNAATRNILTSRNFRFLSKADPSPPEELGIELSAPLEGENGPLCEGEREDSTRSATQKTSTDNPRKRKAETIIDPREPRRTRGVRKDYRYLHNPFPDEKEAGMLCIAKEQAFTVIPGDDCHSLKEARESPDWPEWEKAIQTELEQLRRMGTWKLVDKPVSAVPIANKWVFTKKRNKEGVLTKYKARLVAKGCAQRLGHDYLETHSPVVRLETIQAILAIAPTRKLHMQQMDIKGAYLNGTLKERVYMQQLEGFADGTSRVCLLIKTLYGLKQAGRKWNIELDTKLRRRGYTRLRSDPCAYIWRIGEEFAIITVWVDDLLLFATSIKLMSKMKLDIKAKWEVTDLGEPTKIVGIEITMGRDTIAISQTRYIESILKKEGLKRANPVGMPLDLNSPLKPNPEGNEGNRSNSFARLLGELQFIANATRPDIAYAVNRLASYTANPSLQHVGALKRILRYLKGTKDLGIVYKALPLEPNFFYRYADASYGNGDDRRSISGYVFLAGNGAITWSSRKQVSIALSSTEAEYVALAEAAREACWLKSLYSELGLLQEDVPTLIQGDNDGSIAMARNPQFHKRSKHIAIRWHWIHDLVQEGKVFINSCCDPEQTADVLTKALPCPKHQKHTREMGLVPV